MKQHSAYSVGNETCSAPPAEENAIERYSNWKTGLFFSTMPLLASPLYLFIKTPNFKGLGASLLNLFCQCGVPMIVVSILVSANNDVTSHLPQKIYKKWKNNALIVGGLCIMVYTVLAILEIDNNTSSVFVAIINAVFLFLGIWIGCTSYTDSIKFVKQGGDSHGA